MKKIICVLLMLSIVCSIVACKSDKETETETTETVNLHEYAENLRTAHYELGMLGLFVDTTCYYIGYYWDTGVSNGKTKEYSIELILNAMEDKGTAERARNSIKKLDVALDNLKDAPEEYKDAYDALMLCYSAYQSYPEWGKIPSDNYSTYMSKYNSASDDFIDYYRYFDTILDASLKKNGEGALDREAPETVFEWFETK